MKVWKRLGWILLAVLLVDLGIAATIHRSSAAAFAAGEATWLMQAESLARDLDLTYTRADFDRATLRRRADPPDLALASGSRGRRIVFDRPFPYALWLSPFVGLWPQTGAAVANGLLLMLAALAAARVLWPRVGAWTPWWIAVLVFASAAFGFVVPATGEVFLLAVTVAGLALLIPSPRPCARAGTCAFLAGALLAIPLASDGLYGVLLAAAWWVPAREERPAARRGLALGAAAMLAAVLLVHALAGGGFFLAPNGFRFTAATGYPLVDFPAAEWSETLRHLHQHDAGAFSWDPELRLWSFVDLLLGRAIGLVPYFAPLILILAGGSARGFRRPIVAAAAVWAAAIVLLRPFDVAGAASGLANPLFLPVYGALWLVLDERRRPWRFVAGTAAALLVAWPLVGGWWRTPEVVAAARGDAPGHESAAARRWLPYETSQRWRLGGPAAEHGGLTVEAVGDAAWVEVRRQRVVLDGGVSELVISAPRPLSAVRVDFEEAAAGELRVRGGTIEPAADPAAPGRAASVALAGLRRRHPSGWSPRRSYRYVLALELPPSAAPAALRLSTAN